jgi:phage-related protein
MDGLVSAVGNGISSLIGGAFAGIGAALRGIVDALNRALPGGMLAAVAFVVLVVVAWQLIKR